MQHVFNTERVVLCVLVQILSQCLAGPHKFPDEIWETPSNTGKAHSECVSVSKALIDYTSH